MNQIIPPRCFRSRHQFMRPTFRLSAALTLMLCIGWPLHAAPAAEFYTTLLNRGVVSFNAGRHQEAVQQLRIAAFGFVDSPDLYQTAQTYLTVAHQRLGDTERAREAARKIVAAQRVGPRFGAIELPVPLRNAFDTAAASLLNPVELTTLRGGATTNPVPSSTASAPPQTSAPRPQPPVQQTVPATAAAPAQNPVTRNPAVAEPAQQRPATTTTTRSTEITIPFPAQQPATGTARPQGDRTPSTTAGSSAPAATAPASTSSSSTSGAAVTPSRSSSESSSQPASPSRVPATSGSTAPALSRPATNPAATAPPRPAAPAALSATEVSSRLANAERSLGAARLSDARAIYRDLLSRPGVERSSLLRLAEGLYRSRDFANALEAFRRLGTLTRSEEPYRYYIAVALYETGDYARARQELATVLPFIEVTPDVARYRAKIDGSTQ